LGVREIVVVTCIIITLSSTLLLYVGFNPEVSMNSKIAFMRSKDGTRINAEVLSEEPNSTVKVFANYNNVTFHSKNWEFILTAGSILREPPRLVNVTDTQTGQTRLELLITSIFFGFRIYYQDQSEYSYGTTRPKVYLGSETIDENFTVTYEEYVKAFEKNIGEFTTQYEIGKIRVANKETKMRDMSFEHDNETDVWVQQAAIEVNLVVTYPISDELQKNTAIIIAAVVGNIAVVAFTIFIPRPTIKELFKRAPEAMIFTTVGIILISLFVALGALGFLPWGIIGILCSIIIGLFTWLMNVISKTKEAKK